MKLVAPLTLVALIATMAISCSKEQSVDTGGSGSKNKIKTYTESYTYPGVGSYSETFNITYDNQDRVTLAQSTTSAGNKFQYTYSPDHFVLEIFAAGQLTIHNTCYLNNQSLVDSSIQYNDEQDTMVTKYVYNANKQLIQERMYDYSKITGLDLFDITNYTYDAGGLLTKEESTDQETTYKYDQVFNTTVNIGAPYMPVNLRLPTQTIVSVSGDVETFDHAYTYDSNKRLTSEAATSASGIVISRSYTYY